MSARAKRLAKYLEEELGWTVYSDTTECPKCHRLVYGTKFCPDCGTKQGRPTKARKEVEQELEEAIESTI
jgi:ribosomal protein L32